MPRTCSYNDAENIEPELETSLTISQTGKLAATHPGEHCQVAVQNARFQLCVSKYFIFIYFISVSGRPSGTDVSQTNYTLSNLSSATVI